MDPRRIRKLRVRQNLGKYRVERRLAEGGFATVYRAHDSIEGISVAVKIPHPHLMTNSALEHFRKEVRVNAKLDHPNILPIKNAGFIEERFIIVYPLGRGTLADRLRRRLSPRLALHFVEQMLHALAFAHGKGVMHLDVKPENFIVFDDDRLRLADFGIAKVAQRTVAASGAGTLGYFAPEQAMGKPSPRSDVFATGLLLYQMFSGRLPEWPFEWPPPGFDRLRRRAHPQFIALIRRAMQVDHRERFADARRMLAAFQRVKPRALLPGARSLASSNGQPAARRRERNWKTLRVQEFLRRYRGPLEMRSTCDHCGEPVSESMQHCPWCGVRREKHRDETRFPARCMRCKRGMKLDWRYCPWCYGPALGPRSNRKYTDTRYAARCANRLCDRKALMPFMRYCPWCRTKVRRKWPLPPPAGGAGEATRERCTRCGHGVVSEFWSWCPWCGRDIAG